METDTYENEKVRRDLFTKTENTNMQKTEKVTEIDFSIAENELDDNTETSKAESNVDEKENEKEVN